MVDTLSLEGKVAIITGSGRETGIGAATAVALARNGASVTINYVSPGTAPKAAKVKKNIEDAGGKAVVVQADVTTPEGTAKLVKETLEGFKTDKIDILGKSFPISNAPISMQLTSSLQSTMPPPFTTRERSWRLRWKTLTRHSP